MKTLSQHISESFSETNESILDGTTGRKTSNVFTTNGRKESEEGVTESTEEEVKEEKSGEESIQESLENSSNEEETQSED